MAVARAGEASGGRWPSVAERTGAAPAYGQLGGGRHGVAGEL